MHLKKVKKKSGGGKKQVKGIFFVQDLDDADEEYGEDEGRTQASPGLCICAGCALSLCRRYNRQWRHDPTWNPNPTTESIQMTPT